MGHNIIAFKPNFDFITELRIGGRKRFYTKIYSALQSPESNAIDSGNGDVKFISLDLLHKAKRSHDITIAEDLFLRRCIEICDKEGVIIQFN